MIATTLEHKSVMRLDIIGTDENIQDAIVNYMPKLSHCGPSGAGAGNCLEDERVFIIRSTVRALTSGWTQKGGGDNDQLYMTCVLVDDKSFGMQELSLGSKLVDGGLVLLLSSSSSLAACFAEFMSFWGWLALITCAL